MVFLIVVVLLFVVVVGMKAHYRKMMMQKNRALVRQMREYALLEKRNESLTTELESLATEKNTLYSCMKMLLRQQNDTDDG